MRESLNGVDSGAWMLIALILSSALMIPQLGDAFGGFHGMSEAYFTQLGQSLLDNPLKYPTRPDGSAQSDNILLPYLLYVSFKVFGVSEASARFVVVAFTLAAIAAVYHICKRLYGARTAAYASLILAATPMNVLVGRNVQPDTVFVSLGLSAVCLFLKGGRRNTILAGALAFLSFLAKLPGILFTIGIIAYVISEKRSDVLNDPRLKTFLVTSLLIMIPYLAYNLAFHQQGFLSAVTSRVMLAASEEGSNNGPDMIAYETFYGLSPLIALAFLAGLAYSIAKHRENNTLPLIFSAMFLLFFLVYNKHSYYILPLAPFAAMIAANALAGIREKRVETALMILLVLSGAFYSLLMLCGNKYGYREYERLPGIYGEEDAAIAVSDHISDNFIDLVTYYNPRAEVIRLKNVREGEDCLMPLDYTRPTYNLLHRSELSLNALNEDMRARLLERSAASDVYALSFFGIVFSAEPANQHFFTHGRLRMNRAKDVRGTGPVKLGEAPELFLVKLKEGERLYRREDGAYSIRGRAGF
ncbi:MAG: hypothetical protein GF416_05320 [Candidatus Altiarchaeales archaeon]|nr:hypothetical protein [Candidatus Altiarchaeales archaeon]MBD3416537.1 hypothetical protein [Candidatus Altiarchaeales archaeon]